MGQDSRRYKRKFRNFLIDRKVQLRFVAFSVLLSAALTTCLGYFWYAEMRKASGVIRVNSIATLGVKVATELGDELKSQDNQRLLVLAGFAVLFGLLVAASGIILTHKIAGPLFKISRHMKDIADNRLYEVWGLRKGDQLQEFFADFQSMNDALRKRVEEDLHQLGELASRIERGEDLRAQLPALRQLLSQKQDSLRSAGTTTMRLQRPSGAGGPTDA